MIARRSPLSEMKFRQQNLLPWGSMREILPFIGRSWRTAAGYHNVGFFRPATDRAKVEDRAGMDIK
jgi:hypothetical protein